jgi:hypothetical protein
VRMRFAPSYTDLCDMRQADIAIDRAIEDLDRLQAEGGLLA